jgi:hypothetical protein
MQRRRLGPSRDNLPKIPAFSGLLNPLLTLLRRNWESCRIGTVGRLGLSISVYPLG